MAKRDKAELSKLVSILMILTLVVVSLPLVMFATPAAAQLSLQLAFTQQSTTLSIGEIGNWTVTITNPNPLPVTGQTLVVTLTIDFVVTDNGGGIYAPGPPQTITWTNLTIPGGGTVSKTFRALPACDAATGERIDAAVGGVTAHSSPVTVNYPRLANVKVDNAGQTVTEASLGDVVTWNVSLQNTGTGDFINGVDVTDALGTGMAFISTTAPQWPTWNTGRLNAGVTATYQVVARVNACHELINDATASWGYTGHNCQLITAEASIKLLIKEPNLTYTVVPSNIVVPYCGNRSVAINYQNTGEGNAHDVRMVFQNFPADYEITNVVGATWDPGNSSFTIGLVGAGSSGTITFDFRARYGSCSAASGVMAVRPYYYDDCDEEWYPPTSLVYYSIEAGTAPSLEVVKTGTNAVYVNGNATFNLRVVYRKGNSPAGSITTDIVDIYPGNFVVIDPGGGVANATAHTITWASQTLVDAVPWTRTIRLHGTTDLCDCGHVFNNTLNVAGVIDYCNCPLSGSASMGVIIQCEGSIIGESYKTASPNPQENCETITYTDTYEFALVGNATWSDITFTKPADNGQTFPGNSTSGTVTFVVDPGPGNCTTTKTLTLGAPLNLGFLESDCSPLADYTVLQISYPLYQWNTGIFVDWSDLHVEGHPYGCGNDTSIHEGAWVDVGRSDFSIGLTYPYNMDSCGQYDFTINLTKNGTWNGYDMSIAYDDTDFGYIGPATISGIKDGSGVPIPSFEPTRAGHLLTWDLGPEVSTGGTITFKVQKTCAPQRQIHAYLNYKDNCGTDLSDSAYGEPLLLNIADVVIDKTPEMVYALTKNANWRIYVTNKGSGTARNTEVVDTLDSDLIYDHSTIDGNPASPTVIGDTITWDLGNVSAGLTHIIGLYGNITGCQHLNNDVLARWGCEGAYCQETTDSSRVELPPADVVIVQHSASPVDYCGDHFTFTVKGKATGRPDSYHVRLVQELPPGISYSDTEAYSYVGGYGPLTGDPTVTTAGNTVTGIKITWDFANVLPFNSDGDRAMKPGSVITIVYSGVNINSCADAARFAASDQRAVAYAEFDPPCQAITPEPDSRSPNAVVYLNTAYQMVLALKDGRNLTTGGPWANWVIALPHDTVEWRIHFTSSGDYRAANVTASDTLPTNVSYVAGSGLLDGATPLPDGWTSGYNLGDMPISGANSTHEITFRTTVTATAPTNPNTGTAEGGCCPGIGNWESYSSVNLVTRPNVIFQVASSNFNTCTGDKTITITNTGARANVTSIIDDLPYGYVWDPSGSCNITSNQAHPGNLTCAGVDVSDPHRPTWRNNNVDYLETDETVTIRFQVKGNGSWCDFSAANDAVDPFDVPIPNLTNLGTFNYLDYDGNPYQVTDTDTVDPVQPDIDMTKLPLMQIVPRYGQANWTITLTNEGDGAAGNITLTDVLGNGFSSPGDNQGGSWVGNTGTWVIPGTIPPSGTWAVTVHGTVGVGSLLDHATVVGNCTDHGGSSICTYSYDEADAYTAGFSLSKSVDKPTANVGEELTYHVTAAFVNTDWFRNVTIVDTLPPWVEFISQQPWPGGNNTNPPFGNGTLAGGVGATGQTLTWAPAAFQGPKTLDYQIKARIRNNAANHGAPGATVLTNSVVANFCIDFTGDGTCETTFPPVTKTASTTVTEPKSRITKTIVPATDRQAGDTVTITLTAYNDGDGRAYKVRVWDLVNDTNGDGKVDASDKIVYDCSSIAPGTTPGNFTYAVTGTAPACNVTYTITGDNYIPALSSRVFTFTARISGSVITGSTYSYTDYGRLDERSLPPSDPKSGNPTYDRPSTASGTATVQMLSPSVTKGIIVHSESFTPLANSTSPPGPQMAIGEVFTYRMVYTFPAGKTSTVTLGDELGVPASYGDLGYIPGTATLDRSSGNLTCLNNPGGINSNTPGNPVSVTPTPTGSPPTRWSLDLGNVTNSLTSTTATYRLVLKMVGNNSAVNDSAGGGKVLRDQGLLDYRDAGNTARTATSGYYYAHIAESQPSILKGRNPPTGQGGDTITFTLTIGNYASGGNGTSAFDWVFTDPLPSDYENPQVTNINVGGTGAVVTASFTGNTLNGTIDRLDISEAITVTYTAQLKTTVPFGKVITNTACFTTTSLPGPRGTGNATPGNPGDPNGKRTGSGTPSYNDLRGCSSASVTVSGASISKDILNFQSWYPINANATFVIRVPVPEGTSSSFRVTDRLPGNLTLVYNDSLTVTMPGGATSTHTPLVDTNPLFFSQSGTDILFDFGNITVPSAGNITITYHALVNNVIQNQDGSIRTNQVMLQYNNVTGNWTLNQQSVRVGEPNLTMTKAITAGEFCSEAGDTVSWRVTITNDGHTIAYQGFWNDILPNGLYYISNVAVGTGGGNVYLNGTSTPLTSSHAHVTTTTNPDNTVYLELFQMDPGATITVTFDSVLMNSVTPGQILTDTTCTTYASLANDGRNASGGGDDDTDDRLDNYLECASKSLTVMLQPSCALTVPTAVCAQSTGNTASVPNAGVGATYNWTVTGQGSLTGGNNTRSITWSALSAGTATVGVTVTNGYACQCANSTLVTVWALPSCTITAPAQICAEATGNLASVPNAGVGATYNWNITGGTITAGQGTREITWTAGSGPTANIGVTVTDANGCQCSANVNVTVNSTPTATASSNTPVCEGDPIELTGGPDGMASYLWTGPAGFNSGHQSPTRPNATLAMSGTYTLTVTAGNGCTDSVDTSVVVHPCTGPDQPTNVSPTSGECVTVPVTLTASAFSPQYPGDMHAASQWQVRTAAGSYASPVFDSNRDTVHLTSISVGGLNDGETYYWHVRYQDGHGGWSIYSTETSFNTQNTPIRTDVTVTQNGATITFSEVTVAGCTIAATSNSNPAPRSLPPNTCALLPYYNLTTTAASIPPITVELSYNPAAVQDPGTLKMYHWTGAGWEDCTVLVDTVNHIVYGRVNSLSPFCLGGHCAGAVQPGGAMLLWLKGLDLLEGFLDYFASVSVQFHKGADGQWELGYLHAGPTEKGTAVLDDLVTIVHKGLDFVAQFTTLFPAPADVWLNTQ